MWKIVINKNNTRINFMFYVLIPANLLLHPVLVLFWDHALFTSFILGTNDFAWYTVDAS